MSKLENSQYFSLTFFEKENFLIDFLKQIHQLIHGKFYFDKKLQDFIYFCKGSDKVLKIWFKSSVTSIISVKLSSVGADK
jgi:hypothetical protein